MVKRLPVIVLLAALAGALAVFMVIFSRDKPAEAGSPPPAALVYVLTAGEGQEIIRIAVENKSGGYTVLCKPGEDPVIEGFEDIPLNRSALFLLVSRLGRLVSRELVEPAADLAPFGLAEPEARVTLVFSNGREALLDIGSGAPDGRNSYVKTGDSPVIHLVSSTEVGDCLLRAADFVDKAVTPPNESPDAPVFGTITLGGLVRGNEPVTIVYSPELREQSAAGLFNPYRITRPVDAGVGSDRGLPVLQALFGIQADRVAARLGGTLSPADFGLEEPYSTAAVSGTLGGGLGGFSLRASAPNEQGLVYVQSEGSELVYEIERSKLLWLEAGFFDLMERLVILPHIDTVASVELRRGTPFVSFTLSGEGDDLLVYAGETVINTAHFRSFYQTLITALYDEYYDKPLAEGAVPILEIIYRYRDGKTPDTVAFYPATSRRVLTSLNGRRPFYTYAAFVDKVVADCERILAGNRVLPYL